ncbi:hypothetical protein ACFQ7W_13765 [Streptomyces niveus]|uniref:hypothetical protein n=1 Tax=Streptomyces niveus TaxID=193462 RepID=UPI003693187E
MSDDDNRRTALGDQGERRVRRRQQALACHLAGGLVRDAGVAAMPLSSYYGKSEDGVGLLRFVFCKRRETLDGGVRGVLATQALTDR